MKIQSTALHINSQNGYKIAITKYASDKGTNQIIVISSATGVLQKYYSKFASYATSKGFVVFTFDYSGIGSSNNAIQELKNNKCTLKSWGSIDQATVLAYAKKEHPEASLTLITHSIGGQLIGFNPNHHMIDKIIMVASQTGYWRYFKGLHSFKMLLFWYFLIPIFTPLFSFFPAKKLGLFENLPKNMVYEWASWGKQKKYMMHFYNSKDYFFDAIQKPMLALSFSKDTFAPKPAVDWMVSQYKNAVVKRVHHHPRKGEKHVKHFGFFKTTFKDPFWNQTINWILTNSYT